MSDELHANYAEIRERLGWTWQQMADHLRTLGANDLADWAASHVDKSARASKGSERAVKGAPEKRG